MRKNENKQEQTDNIFKSGQTRSGLNSRSTSSRPNNARDVGKKKDSDAMSEHRDSSDMNEDNMNEDKYTRAPLKPHDWYTVADLGAPYMELDLDMAMYVDECGSKGLVRIGGKVGEDGREGRVGEDEREEPQEAEGEAAVELVDNEEANLFNSDQPWNWWSKEFLEETVKVNERQEHAVVGHKASVADSLLAAWTTVKPVI